MQPVREGATTGVLRAGARLHAHPPSPHASPTIPSLAYPLLPCSTVPSSPLLTVPLASLDRFAPREQTHVAHRCRQELLGNAPCTPHPQTPLLHRTRAYDDRPHMATRAFYLERIFRAIARNVRTTTEVCAWISRADPFDEWLIWFYGERGNMTHDVHLAPMGSGSSYAALTGAHKVAGAAAGQLKERPPNVPTTFAHAPPG